MADNSKKLVGFITTPTDRGVDIARAIVEQRLAACVNIVGTVRSLYWWQGKVEDDNESLLIVKTTEDALPALTAGIRAIHPYETFELVVMNIDDGNAPYLEWIAESVSADGRGTA